MINKLTKRMMILWQSRRHLKIYISRTMRRIGQMIILTGIASSIAYLHSKKVCHGRLGSNNVLLDKENAYAKLVCYGFCGYFMRESNEDGMISDIREFGKIAQCIIYS